MIETLDTSVRLIAVGASLLLLTLLLAGQVRPAIKLALAGLLISAAAYLINSSTVIHPPRPIRPYIDLASVFTPYWTWLFGRRLFEDEPPRPMLYAVAVALLLGWYTAHFIPSVDPAGFYAIHLVSLGLVADLLRVAFGARADDLLEKRRMIRLWLPLLVAVQTGGVLLFETLAGRASPFPPVQLANAVLILALTLFAGIALLRTDEELLAEPSDASPLDAGKAELSASEAVLKDKLAAAMASGLYRSAGLTIARLAEQLGTPEHRLRALINRRLGYRNFSAYLNRHRIDEAQAILADSARVDLPVLTIAMDLGYNSLPTFNRAFRSETGMTPTDFRRDRLAQN